MEPRSYIAVILTALVLVPLPAIGQSAQSGISNESGKSQTNPSWSSGGFGEHGRRVDASYQRGKEPLATKLVVKNGTLRLGDPIIISVSATNPSPESAQVDKSATAFNCFEVIDPDGQEMPYVGYDGQVQMRPTLVQSFSTATIADEVDLTDKYVFRKAGRYVVRFISAPGKPLANSPVISIEIAPGQVSDMDQAALSLMSILPKGWKLVKHTGDGDLTPPGRTRVPGKSLHLCHNHMQWESVYLYFTKAEAKADLARNPIPDAKYLGRVRSLFAYAKVDKNTPQLWPTAIEDISRALQTVE